mmetsp:Transcript_15851/g.37493  ORF Transcript_15851/g.37493 Transcript_15851/m.37493 type:complete len:275 (-) Transcript_15851:329-1153(-)
MAAPLSLTEAVDTLHSMFTGLDREIIAEILKTQGGHMERTVEVLLQLAGDESESIPQDFEQQAPAPAPASDSGGFLPADFLQPERYHGDAGESQPSGDSQRQMEQDEALARALQNQMFLQELRSDPAMAQELHRGRPAGDIRQQRTPSGGMPPIQQDDSVFSAEAVMGSMKTMGEAAKRKMTLMARAFNTKVKGANAPPAASTAQYRSLPLGDDDGDDAEVVAFENEDGQVARRGGRALDEDEGGYSLEDRRRTRPSQQRVVPVGGGGPSKKDD